MNIIVGNANVTKLIQSNTLARQIGEQLFPAMLYRGLAFREPWEGAVGQTGAQNPQPVQLSRVMSGRPRRSMRIA